MVKGEGRALRERLLLSQSYYYSFSLTIEVFSRPREGERKTLSHRWQGEKKKRGVRSAGTYVCVVN